MSMAADYSIDPEKLPPPDSEERWRSLDYVRGIYVLTALVSAARTAGLLPSLSRRHSLREVDHRRNLQAVETSYVSKLGLHIVQISGLENVPAEQALVGTVETERIRREQELKHLATEFELEIGENPVTYTAVTGFKPIELKLDSAVRVLDKVSFVKADLYHEQAALAERLATNFSE